MNIRHIQVAIVFGVIQSGIALECYKCPARMRDIFLCSDPFEKDNYGMTCATEEDVCLKISVRRRSNHLEERGCASRKSVETICNRVRQNFPPEDVICAVCETDLCNGSSHQGTMTIILYLLPLTFTFIKIHTIT